MAIRINKRHPMSTKVVDKQTELSWQQGKDAALIERNRYTMTEVYGQYYYESLEPGYDSDSAPL